MSVSATLSVSAASSDRERSHERETRDKAIPDKRARELMEQALGPQRSADAGSGMRAVYAALRDVALPGDGMQPLGPGLALPDPDAESTQDEVHEAEVHEALQACCLEMEEEREAPEDELAGEGLAQGVAAGGSAVPVPVAAWLPLPDVTPTRGGAARKELARDAARTGGGKGWDRAAARSDARESRHVFDVQDAAAQAQEVQPGDPLEGDDLDEEQRRVRQILAEGSVGDRGRRRGAVWAWRHLRKAEAVEADPPAGQEST